MNGNNPSTKVAAMASMFQQPSSVQAEKDGKHVKKGRQSLPIVEDASVSDCRKKATVSRTNSQINRFSSAKKMFTGKVQDKVS